VAVNRVPRVPVGDNSAEAWARLVHVIPDSAWTEAAVFALGRRPDSDRSSLRFALLGVASRVDPAARNELLAAARDGSLAAFAELGDVTQIQADVVGDVIGNLTSGLERVRHDAREGKLEFGGYDLGNVLAVLLSYHHDERAAKALLDYLGDGVIPRGSKRGALQAIALNFRMFAPEMHDRIALIAEGVAHQAASLDDSPLQDADIGGEAGFLVGMLGATDGTKLSSQLAALLAGPPRHRAWAAHLAASVDSDDYVGALVALSQDDDPEVRATAGSCAARLVATNRGGLLAEATLRCAATDQGRRVPAAIAATLTSAESQNDVTREVLERLQEHPSARVREWATSVVLSS